MIVTTCILCSLLFVVADAEIYQLAFYGYPAAKQLVYGAPTPAPEEGRTTTYPRPGYPVCPPVYPQPYPLYPVYPYYPQPYYPPTYGYPPAGYPPVGYPSVGYGSQTSGRLTKSKTGRRKRAIESSTFVPTGRGVRAGQEYAIPIVGRLEITAVTKTGVRIENIGGSNRNEGLSKLRFYLIEMADLTQVKAIEVRWQPDPTSPTSNKMLNARRIFLTGSRVVGTEGKPVQALFSRCGGSTEMEPRKTYNFYRGCYKFAPEDDLLTAWYEGSGFLCGDPATPPVTNTRCIEDESINYSRRFGSTPVTIPPSAIVTPPLTR